jgi:hypothetical protein
VLVVHLLVAHLRTRVPRHEQNMHMCAISVQRRIRRPQGDAMRMLRSEGCEVQGFLPLSIDANALTGFKSQRQLRPARYVMRPSACVVAM